MRRVRPRDRRRPSRRCATTTSTVRGCRATRRTPGWRASSGPRWPPAPRRACSRTAASGATSSTCATSPAPTCSRSTSAGPGAFNVASGTPRTVLDMARALTRALRRARAGGHRRVAGGRRPARVRLRRRGGRPARLPRGRGLRRRHARVRGRAAEGIDPRCPVAVVGHVEWIEFARVPHVPSPGEIVHATEWWEDVGGGGAVAAVQLAKLAGGAEFFTALADDERGRALARAARGARRDRLRGAAPRRPAPRLRLPRRRPRAHDHDPRRADRPARRRRPAVGAARRGRRRLLQRRRRRRARAGAPGAQAGRHAARATTRCATSRVNLDALVRSAKDPGEQQAEEDLDPAPDIVVSTAGKEGGEWVGEDRTTGHLEGRRAARTAAGRLRRRRLVRRRPDVSALGADLPIEQALEVASRCGAYKLAGRAAVRRPAHRRGSVMHGGALDPPGAQQVERLLGLVERELRARVVRTGTCGASARNSCGVGAREVGDRAQDPLLPQRRGRGTRGCRTCGCRRTPRRRRARWRAARPGRARRPGRR